MSNAAGPAAAITASLARGRWWIVAAAVLSAALTAWLVASTPTRWLSSGRLEIEDRELSPAEVVAQLRSGAVLERWRSSDRTAARLDPAAAAQTLAERVQVNAGEGREVWVTAWAVDGEKARDLLLAVREAAAHEDRARRSKRLGERLAALDAERLSLIRRLDTLAAADDDADPSRPVFAGVVGEEIERARIRRLAERLAAVEEELEQVRAAVAAPGASWRVADAPVPWQYPLPRRLGGPVAAALSLPVLVAALTWLAHDRRRE